MNIKLWLDDERPMPEFFNYHAKTAKEAIDKLKEGNVIYISLDHDLGDNNGTGYDVAKFIEEAAYSGKLKQLVLTTHTQNPVGRANMRAALLNAKRYWMNQTKEKNNEMD